MFDWATQGPILAMLTAAVIAAVAGLRRAWPQLRKFFHLIDDMAGEEARPGVPERPGLMSRMENLEAQQAEATELVTQIKHQVLPNGGDSLRDEVDRNSAQLTAISDRLAQDEGRLEVVEGTLQQLSEQIGMVRKRDE